MNKFLIAINICLVVVLLCGYFSPSISPDETWFFSLFGLFFPIFAFLNIFAVVFWLFREPKYAWISLLPLLLGISSFSKLYQLNNSKKANNNSISLMSYNIRGNHLFSGKTQAERNQKIKNFADFIKRNQNIDVFCFQEEGASTTKKIKEIFTEHQSPSEKYRGTNIYTKLPVVDKGNIKLERNSHNAFWVDLKTESGIVRVYNIHLSSNRISVKTDQLIEEHDLSERKTWSNIKYIFKKYSIHSIKRMQQLELVLGHAESCPHPVVFCGDFNDVPQSYVYSKVRKGRNDSFVEKGNGLGQSYAIGFAPLRIDYFFTDQNIEILSHKVLKETFSDHYPITSIIQLKQ